VRANHSYSVPEVRLGSNIILHNATQGVKVHEQQMTTSRPGDASPDSQWSLSFDRLGALVEPLRLVRAADGARWLSAADLVSAE
jgi:hypothetical protein